MIPLFSWKLISCAAVLAPEAGSLRRVAHLAWESIPNVISNIGTSCSNPFHFLLIMCYHLDMYNPLNKVGVNDWPVATAENGKECDITLVRI